MPAGVGKLRVNKSFAAKISRACPLYPNSFSIDEIVLSQSMTAMMEVGSDKEETRIIADLKIKPRI